MKIGTLSKTHLITVDPSVFLVINPPRRIPFALKKRLKAELDRMTKVGIIKPVSEPTEMGKLPRNCGKAK